MKYATLFTTLALSAALAGCANDKAPTFGEQLQSSGTALKGIGDKWNEGESLIKKGQKLIKSGNKDIEKGEKLQASGEDDVKEGEKLIRDGQAMKAMAEEAYQHQSKDLSPAGD